LGAAPEPRSGLMFGVHTNTGIVDVTEPITFSTVVFRDLDNIQLQLIAM
jgi:hypothetical protein